MINKRIRIEPYPNYHISDEVLERDVIPKISRELNINISGDPTILPVFENGEKRFLMSNVINGNDNKKYITISPNLIHLFIDKSIEEFHKSEELKNKSFPNCAKSYNKINNDCYFLGADVDDTHFCYNLFLGHRMTSIIMLMISIESFMNSLIPYDYKKQRRGRFMEKIDDILLKDLKNTESIRDIIDNIYNIRNDITHLKYEKKIDDYHKVIQKILDIDLYKYITTVINTINDIYELKNGNRFIKWSNNYYINNIGNDKIDYNFIKFYLSINNKDIFEYFLEIDSKISKTKIKKWENNNIPEEYKNNFIDKEGSNIDKFFNNIQDKYGSSI